MRILQIMDEYSSSGGMERFAYNFSEELVRCGHQTVIAARRVDDSAGWGSSQMETKAVSGTADTLAFAKQYHPDLIVWHTGGATSETVEKLAELYPVFATVHGVICPSSARLLRNSDQICYKQAGPGCLLNWYARKCGTNISPVEAIKSIAKHHSVVHALKKCKRVYAVSSAIERFLQIEGIPNANIRVFDNTMGGITEMVPLQLPESVSRIRLLYVGRLVYAKGVQYLLRAVSELRSLGYAPECTIVGEGWYRPQLEELAVKLGIQAAVTFTGRVPGQKISQWYEQSDVVVVPSIWPDPSPLVVPEARRLGKPVVVFRAGGLPEWADFMDGIYVAEHGNHMSLAETIRSVVEGKAEQPGGTFESKCQRRDIIDEISCLMPIS